MALDCSPCRGPIPGTPYLTHLRPVSSALTAGFESGPYSKLNDSVRVLTRTYEYGPCVGVTRLERWERAAALGLNPPPEVTLN